MARREAGGRPTSFQIVEPRALTLKNPMESTIQNSN
jgi:hypothetical protein